MPEKDRDKEEYASYKNFVTQDLPRRWYSVINFCCWSAVILLPLAWYLIQTAMSGSILRISIVGSLCGAGNQEIKFAFVCLPDLNLLTKYSSLLWIQHPH